MLDLPASASVTLSHEGGDNVGLSTTESLALRGRGVGIKQLFDKAARDELMCRLS